MSKNSELLQDKATLSIGGKDHELPTRNGCYVITAKEANALRNSGDKWITLVVGGFSFLGEGSGPYENGDDEDPERRAEVTGELIIAGQFQYTTESEFKAAVDEAMEAGEQAISSKGYCGVFGDSYVIPEVAGMRFIEG